MNQPIDFNRERQRRQSPKPQSPKPLSSKPGPPKPGPPKRWLGYAIILAAALYALVRAWQMLGQSL